MAEGGILIGAHAAVVLGAVDAFQTVACSFKQSHTIYFSHHVFPLCAKVHLCGDVGLPRFHVGRIHGDGLLLVGVFVSQSGKAVPELMHDHWLEHAVVGHRQVVGV